MASGTLGLRASTAQHPCAKRGLRRAAAEWTANPGAPTNDRRPRGPLRWFVASILKRRRIPMRQRPLARDKIPRERTVSVPACLRRLQFVAVCCSGESGHLQADSVVAVRLSRRGWTPNPRVGGSNPPGRISRRGRSARPRRGSGRGDPGQGHGRAGRSRWERSGADRAAGGAPGRAVGRRLTVVRRS